MSNKLHPKIQELRRRAAPINYGSLSVSEAGTLVNERGSDFDKRIIAGYAVIWGQKNLHGEIFLRGAFAKSIRERGPGSGSNFEIKFLNQHDQRDPLSLFEILEEDEIGLYFRTKPLDEIPSADRAITQLRSGTINNFSHGFDYVWDKVEWDDQIEAIIVREAELYEISTATIPSGMDTYVVRSKDDLDLLADETDWFIKSLPRKLQLEARNIITRYKSLADLEPFEQREITLEETKPTTDGIDYNYLLNNLKH